MTLLFDLKITDFQSGSKKPNAPLAPHVTQPLRECRQPSIIILYTLAEIMCELPSEKCKSVFYKVCETFLRENFGANGVACCRGDSVRKYGMCDVGDARGIIAGAECCMA